MNREEFEFQLNVLLEEQRLAIQWQAEKSKEIHREPMRPAFVINAETNRSNHAIAVWRIKRDLIGRIYGNPA